MNSEVPYEVAEVLRQCLDDGNIVAGFILDNWHAIIKGALRIEENIDMILNPALSVENNEGDFNADYWFDRDLRIEWFCVKGFRGIPINNLDKSIAYGIDFADGASPYSMIILGGNGTGKTSLYSALELVCLGSTSVCEKHHGNKKAPTSFYRNIISNEAFEIKVKFKGESDCRVFQENDEFDIASHIELRPFFCSESDIAIFECRTHDIQKYLDEQIGLNAINDIIKKLEKASEIINDWFDPIPEESENKNIKDQDYEERLLSILNALDEIKELLKSKRQTISSSVLKDAQEIVAALLEDYVDDYVELSTEDNVFDGRLQLKRDPSRKINPDDYYNNFRYKLYLISIRIAISFFIMKSRKLDFPLIFDDIFDSSDFSNRLSTKDYFKKIYSLFNRLKISERPLQIIFFTQDEVIGRSVFDGISLKEKCHLIPQLKILSRLFPVEAIDEEKDKILKYCLSSKQEINQQRYCFYQMVDIIRYSPPIH